MRCEPSCACWSDFFPTVERYNKAMPEHNYLHISHQVIPALLGAGVTQAQIDRMFIDKPRRHFEAAAKRFAALSGGIKPMWPPAKAAGKR